MRCRRAAAAASAPVPCPTAITCALRFSNSPSRPCTSTRCRWQIGQPKWRRNRTASGPRRQSEKSVTGRSSASSRDRSGARSPTASSAMRSTLAAEAPPRDPHHQPRHADRRPPAGDSHLMSPPRSVLVVDAGGHPLEPVAQRLRLLGIPALRAKTAGEARAALAEPRAAIGAVLIPPDPPALDPSRALRALSRSPDGSALPLLVSGPRPDPEACARLRAAGVVFALWEPFDDHT